MSVQRSTRTLLTMLVVTLALLLPFYTKADSKAKKPAPVSRDNAVIWQAPEDITSRNLFYAQGSAEQAPKGICKMVKVDKSGSSYKFIVSDESGVKWHAKVGPEAQAETVAAHLLWAVGYFSDESYYVPVLRVDGLDEKLERSAMPSGELIGNDTLIGARLEPDEKHAVAWNWSWFENPLVGTREFNGLRVMMALINNWDLKESNNKITLDETTGQYHFVVHDLGASFGRTGGVGTRSRNDLNDYLNSQFIKDFDNDHVDLVMDSRPPAIAALSPGYWSKRTEMSKITQKIPRADARWIGELLSKLSDDQIADAFRAANYSTEDVQKFTQALRARIDKLAAL